MSKFKINQKIKLPILVTDKSKRVYFPEKEERYETEEFTVIGDNHYYQEYLVKLNSDMVGYVISGWDVLYLDVDKKHEGSKFWFVQYHQADQYN